eukprot:scaffold100737_cov75-Phaeocystis_antarctica.AAC.5
MAFGGGSFSLTSPTRERRLTDFASCSSSAQRAEKRSSPSTAGAQGRDAGVSRGRSGHVRARDASGGPWCWRNLPNAAATIVDCPHARPRVADEQLNPPLQHRYVVGFGKLHDLAHSLGREVAVGYDPAAQLVERRDTLRSLLRRAATRSSTKGYEVARIA